MTLTKLAFDDYLDLPDHRGQRIERFDFLRVDGVSGEILAQLHPVRTTPQLSHDTTGSIKRRLTLQLNPDDTDSINPLTDRVLPYMVVGGISWPLGRYMFTDDQVNVSTGGDRAACTLLDEGFAIDQQLETSFTRTNNVRSAVLDLIEGVGGLSPVEPIIETTPYLASGSISSGQTRGQGLDSYATQGDYFPYWMDHGGHFHMVRTIDPAGEIPDMDFDAGNKVFRDSITRTSDVLNAPNRFVVISTAADAANSGPVVGVYDVPSSAPFSEHARGFRIADVRQVQVLNSVQATAAARNIGLRSTVFDRITLNTALDPRHDSYNVIRFLGDNWLELGWTMELRPGGNMQHVMRKAYQP